jgi:hypothetical protein
MYSPSKTNNASSMARRENSPPPPQGSRGFTMNKIGLVIGLYCIHKYYTRCFWINTIYKQIMICFTNYNINLYCI